MTGDWDCLLPLLAVHLCLHRDRDLSVCLRPHLPLVPSPPPLTVIAGLGLGLAGWLPGGTDRATSAGWDPRQLLCY